MLYIFNSLTKEKELFKAITPNKINIYVCGITVYDYIHIGHARTFVAFDVIIRYLRFLNYDVTYVRNITDIDDKIIKRANELNISTDELVARFTKAMHEDFAKINVLEPNYEPKATNSIEDIIEFIQTLIQKGFAYCATNGDVYYRVSKFSSYGKLSKQNIDFLRQGVRIELEDAKEDPLDFTLWKKSKEHEPSWDSPWSKGRPGWHIECSTMAKKILGDNFDIHGGGGDLKFPHHENEIAQSQACNDCNFANIWMHTGMVQIDNNKMSKSLGNFFTLRDVLKQYPSESIRYFLLAGHYRSEIHYSKENIDNTHKALAKLYHCLLDLPKTHELPQDEKFSDDFMQAMDNDFNTPEALAVLFGIAKKINILKTTSVIEASKYANLLKHLGKILGILESEPEIFCKNNNNVDTNLVIQLINLRLEAKKEKNWAKADEIREQLATLGIALKDNGDITEWYIMPSQTYL